MNKRRKNKTVKWVIATCAVLTALVIGGVVAFADEALLTPGGTQVTAGEGLSFTVNLNDIKEEYSQGGQDFTLTVVIDPAPESVRVSPDVNLNQYGSKYTVVSADLENISALSFTVYPGKKIMQETTYTVTAEIAGSLSTPSDSFTFKAVPAKNNKPKGGGSAGGLTGGTSTDSSTVYQGSSDNYLKKLSVEGYDFTQKFNSTRDTYFITVPDDVESVNVSATAHDSSATVRVAGNNDISGETSKIMVNVTADNGDVRVYRIFVTHKVEDEQ